MNLGRSVLGAFLTLSLIMSLPVHASDKSCTEAFRNAKETFEVRLRELETNEVIGWGTTVGSFALGAICYFKLPKAGKFARTTVCSGVAGTFAVAGAGWGFNNRIKAGRLRDAYRLYSIYESRHNQDPAKVKEAQAMLSALGVDKQKEAKALEEFATLMDFGKLCDGEMPRTYNEALGIMRDRLHAAE